MGIGKKLLYAGIFWLAIQTIRYSFVLGGTHEKAKTEGKDPNIAVARKTLNDSCDLADYVLQIFKEEQEDLSEKDKQKLYSGKNGPEQNYQTKTIDEKVETTGGTK